MVKSWKLFVIHELTSYNWIISKDTVRRANENVDNSRYDNAGFKKHKKFSGYG